MIKTTIALILLSSPVLAFSPMSWERDRIHYDIKQGEAKISRQNRMAQESPASVWDYPQSTNGRCVKTPLGTKWPGKNGYLNLAEKQKCEGL